MQFYIWCEVWIEVHSFSFFLLFFFLPFPFVSLSFCFCIWILNCFSIICWKGYLFTIKFHLYQKSIKYMCKHSDHFWTPHLSIFIPMLYSFDYSSFVSLGISWYKSSTFVPFIWSCFGLLHFHRTDWSNSIKNVYWGLYHHRLGDSWHFWMSFQCWLF